MCIYVYIYLCVYLTIDIFYIDVDVVTAMSTSRSPGFLFEHIIPDVFVDIILT